MRRSEYRQFVVHCGLSLVVCAVLLLLYVKMDDRLVVDVAVKCGSWVCSVSFRCLFRLGLLSCLLFHTSWGFFKSRFCFHSVCVASCPHYRLLGFIPFKSRVHPTLSCAPPVSPPLSLLNLHLDTMGSLDLLNISFSFQTSWSTASLRAYFDFFCICHRIYTL